MFLNIRPHPDIELAIHASIVLMSQWLSSGASFILKWVRLGGGEFQTGRHAIGKFSRNGAQMVHFVKFWSEDLTSVKKVGAGR